MTVPGTLFSRAVRRRDLTTASREGFSWSLMVGIGETYFAAFVLALGMGEIWAGWIVSIPLLAGGVLQLVTPYGVNLLRSRRRWVMLCAFVQAASFIPLIWGAAGGALAGWLVFAAASVYWAAGLGAGPAWNAWMTGLVPERLRSRYFARRTSATNLGTAIALIAGGFILQLSSDAGRPMIGFTVIFTLAALARLTSARLLTFQTDVPPPPGGERLVRGSRLLGRFIKGPDGRLLVYLGLMTAAVSVASPFFTPYMLRELGFSYAAYMSLIGASFAAKTLALGVMSRLVGRWGAPAILRGASVGIAAIPVLWLVHDSYPYLLGLQVVAGVFWAALELAALLLFFIHIDIRERTSLLTTYNLINATALVGGSLLGGALFEMAGGGIDSYLTLFGVSAGLRLGVLLLLVGRTLPRGRIARFSLRTLAVRPSAGSFARPILGSITRPRDPEPESDAPAENA